MPEEEASGTDLERLLEHLDDYVLNVHNYQALQNALDAENNIRTPVVEKLLSICARDLKDDMKYSVNMLNILATILKKVKTMQCTPLPDLVPSVLSVLQILKTTALFNKVESFKGLCFEIFQSYPDETLINICVNHSSEIFELLNLYCHQRIPLEMRLQPINIIIKVLKILPPEKKMTFVKEGINIWFSKVVPLINISSALPQVLEALELLTEDLVHIDYADNPQWRVVFESIYTPKKYPAVMKGYLEAGNENWHRLWIIFIKLLKNQITKSNNAAGSPINSMLPVVEMAFKMDVTNRCRAFTCWNVLIDNFSTETNEVYINKRIKLLIIPLTSNNAKVEETAISKLKTWWHLLSCFYTRMEKFADIILIPFLHFCFGKPTASDRPVIVPGMISASTKVQVVQAFINIMGHAYCEGCVALPKVKGKVINTKLLVSHWRDWIHALNIAIQICAENSEFSDQHIKCLWMSFIMTVGDLPENNIRRDLFNEVLNLVGKLAEGCNNKLADTISNVLIVILFNNDDKIKPLLKTKDEQNAPIHKIITIILKLPLCNFENRQVVVQNFKGLSIFLIEEAFKSSSHTIECILKYLPEKGLALWVSLADTINERLYTSCPRMLCKMLTWPLNSQNINAFVNDELATTAWIKLYKCVYKVVHTTINEDIIKLLEIYKTKTPSNTFVLSASITILRQKIEEGNGSDFVKEVDFLLKTLSGVSNFKECTSLFSSLFQVVLQILVSLYININLKAAEITVSVISHILKLCNQASEDPTDEVNILKSLEVIFKSLENVLKIEQCSKLKWVLLEPLKECAPYLKKLQPLKECILAIYKNKSDEEDNEHNLKDFIDVFESNEEPNVMGGQKDELGKQCPDKVNNFTTPNAKTVAKKQRKKEDKIVNTVVENGEEYVVVKSNWKFNPRKLTENQKEKFQRKREDIPALYQDLSQSQDEFKLTTWKTDSQDTTTTTSKSTSEAGNEDVSSILKTIPTSDFVPKVLQTIMGKDKEEIDLNITPAKENTKTDTKKEENRKDDSNKLQVVTKETKSPRLALKDRVFRNVRNLIEKSNLPNETTEVNTSLVENVPKTPLSKMKPSVNLINSAPTLISADRPSRLKRKPKKFEDLEVFGLKKRRHSSGQNDSPTDEVIENGTTQTNITIDHEKELPSENEVKSKEVDNNEVYTFSKETIPSINENTPSNNCDPKVISDDLIIEDKNKLKDDNLTSPNTSDKKFNDEILQSEEKTEIKETLSLTNEKIQETTDNPNQDLNLGTNTKASDKNKLQDVPKSSKKATSKKSRIEKELAIDMVEGHPFLTVQSDKRLTRKAISNSPCTRKSLTKKIKNKTETRTPKSEKKLKEKEKSISIEETQNTNEDTLASQDFIESSQESTITTISVKSSKSIGKKLPLEAKTDKEVETQSLLEEMPDDHNVTNTVNKDDTELPLNKTVDEKVLIDLTENMDTETINTDDVIIINDDDDQFVLNKIDDKIVDLATQNTAEGDTQSLDPYIFQDDDDDNNKPAEGITSSTIKYNDLNENNAESVVDNDITNASLFTTPNDETKTMSESVLAIVEKEDLNSPFKDEEQRKKDFLNNTLEISPIKTLSPMREKKSPSPETSSDYVVIKLSSPVQSNGEPFEKVESPEIFTEEKITPDKRDQSPPREEVSVTNTSPSSCLSLKRNRPQVRPGGRAAQMLGLCVPDRLQTIMMSDKSCEGDENKKSPSLNTSARRNLRILYNSSPGEAQETSEETDDSENFLKLKRNLPATDCSPSGPILKRKLADITDEATASPASKRKRVSFHDPPVSTTICVKKYIEPGGVRSPQNSAIKRQERQLRSQLATKSPKRLDNVFKLDSVLTKAVESFTDNNATPNTNDDSEMSSIEQTPVVQIIKTTDLNNTDPICPELINCKDPISNIACELSSPAMKVLLIKELEGKINTVGDLAKLTELDINRLCIKAPKVQVAKKVLSEYLKTMKEADEEITPTVEAAMEETISESKSSVEVQTNRVLLENVEMQTEEFVVSSGGTQTDSVSTAHCSAQTDESGSKTTAELVSTCLSDRTDFVEELCEKMDESSKKKIINDLSFNALTDIFVSRLTRSNSDLVLDKVLEQKSNLDKPNEDNKDRRLSTVRDYLCERFESKDLVLFCSELLKKVYDKP